MHWRKSATNMRKSGTIAHRKMMSGLNSHENASKGMHILLSGSITSGSASMARWPATCELSRIVKCFGF